MAKKSARKPAARGSSSSRQTPASLRKKIERLDRDLLKLVQDRAKLVSQTARLEDAELGTISRGIANTLRETFMPQK